MKIAVLGLGYWGPNLVRNFLLTRGVDGVVVFDANPVQVERTVRRFPGIEVGESVEQILNDPGVEGVVIATPATTHFPLGLKCLEAGKHLLVEKPLALTSKDAETLLEAACRNGLTLMVDHTFVYTGAVRKMKELIDSGIMGDLLYLDSVRVNLGLFQHDTNVLWDLAPHDLSILAYLIDQKPERISAVGVNHFNGVEDMAYLTLFFRNKLIAHIHVNWMSPVKVRKILLGGTKHMIVYDDMDPSEKIKVYDKGVDVNGEESLYKTLVQYRMGNMFAPHLESTEALASMAAEFVDAITMKRKPASDGESGLYIVKVLEAAERSLRTGGTSIPLQW